MTRLTRLCRAMGVGLAVAAATLSMTQVANAAPAPPVPDKLVPKGVSEFLVAHAKGVQIYQCTETKPNTFEWKFLEPRADLVGDNGQRIKHFKGPTWTAEADGSGVIRDPSKVVESAPSPAPGPAIDWLLVPVAPAPGASNDAGDLLTGTTFIQRLNTKSGTAPPAASCKAQTAGKVKEVPYQADYVFFR